MQSCNSGRQNTDGIVDVPICYHDDAAARIWEIIIGGRELKPLYITKGNTFNTAPKDIKNLINILYRCIIEMFDSLHRPCCGGLCGSDSHRAL